MAVKSQILRAIYPLLIKAGKLFGVKAGIYNNPGNIVPPVSFYSLQAVRNNGEVIDFVKFRGKKVLLVNTASDCGYTGQLSELQQLHEMYKDKLVIVGFPANDFKEQEKGSDAEIAAFCTGTFGITFPLSKKAQVIKGDGQSEVFKWLTSKDKNGWCDKEPEWNFAKYLVNEQGILTHYFGPGISPVSDKVKTALDTKVKH